MKDKEKQLTAAIEKVLRDTQNCGMSIETLTDYLVDRIKNKVFPEDSVVLSREDIQNLANFETGDWASTASIRKIANAVEKQASKETAEKILRKGHEYLMNSTDKAVAFACFLGAMEHDYGVEIKE